MPTVVIAGASRGLGLELARQYAAEGWTVVAGCRRPDEAGALRELAEAGPVELLPLDTASMASVTAFRTALGDRAIDVLVIPAGIAGGDRQRLGDIDYADLASILDTNVAGPLRLAEAFADTLAAGRDAKLVAISSIMGSIAETASTEMMLYRISKAALNEAWKCVAIELAAKGVTAMVLHPGWVATDMGGARAPVAPADSARGMRDVIAGLRLEDAGTFRTFEGATLPW